MQANNKLREALEYLRDASREFHHLILNSKHNEICDKYKYPEVAKIRDAIANAGLVLAASSEPIGNNAKMYEALAAYLALWDNGTMNSIDKLKRVIKQMREALAAPPRNCDVGTADERTDRYLDFCNSHAHCADCPCNKIDGYCEFAWEGLPYKEGGAE